MSLRSRFISNRSLDQIYRFLVDEEDARVCEGIEESACKALPGNFLLQILTQFLTKIGDAVANPKTILAWLMSALAAPAVFTAFLVPIRESGSLIPQLVIARFVRQQPKRKWVFVLGCVLQAVAVFSMAAVAASSSGVTAGILLLLALIGFSLARGLCSVASKDVLGKTVPKSRRGRVSGWSASLAGIITICIGGFLLLDIGKPDSVAVYLGLLVIAGVLWLIAAAVYASIREEPGATSGGGNAFTEAVKSLRLLGSDKPFRQFVIARSLLLCSALSAPFFIMLAHENTEGKLLVLGLFVIADGLASLISAPVWGKFADRSSRMVLVVSGSAAGLVGLSLVLSIVMVPILATSVWIYPLFFFLLAMAHAGVRVGRKTYVVDLAEGDKRTDYVAVSNSVIGVALLLAGGVGSLATLLSVSAVICILAGMGLAGALLSSRLKEVSL